IRRRLAFDLAAPGRARAPQQLRRQGHVAWRCSTRRRPPHLLELRVKLARALGASQARLEERALRQSRRRRARVHSAAGLSARLIVFLAAKLRPESQKLTWRRGGRAVRLENFTGSSGDREFCEEENAFFVFGGPKQEIFPWR